MSQDPSIVADTIKVLGSLTTSNGNFSTDATSGNLTMAGVALFSSKKLGFAANGDFVDASGATQVRKLGPTSTKLQDNIAATTNNWTDANANQINSGGTKISASANGAIAHTYAGTLTPTLINTMLTVAGTVIWGTIGTANATITMSAAGAYIAQAQLV